ncbi:MAG: carbohydrate-binding protein [Myxococcales bacterium]|nr:MAG: carbohydrate-binding protein [Myxococcales bacterium]
MTKVGISTLGSVAFCVSLLLSGCAEDPRPSEPEPLGRATQALTGATPSNCGYTLSSGAFGTWPGGYQAWVELRNVSGPVATTFQVLVDVGGGTITAGHLADYAPAEGGYLVSAPSWLRYQTIPALGSYRFQFNGAPQYLGVKPYLISVNGVVCDTTAPLVTLAASTELITSARSLTLTAQASDDTVVSKVVFERDGAVIATDTQAPFVAELGVTEADNGRHLYTATAYDAAGNHTGSAPVRVLVAINDKFLGTAPGGPEDYTHLLSYFDQLTPENAGKWGVVEAERDVMSFGELDAAYAFSREHGLRFKLHTLIWGQQQPAWLAALSPEEQLAEIKEWFAALSARYPDAEMVDVVNEPLHAVPSYAAALGGAGQTGWDWMIRSFELARQYFPRSQLLLNDYNILILEPFTAQYVELVELLDERGLIDGIGEQSHFLERAELPVVQANLNTLAATGLPLYISELDVSFADDARQAQRLRDLFSLFWAHPSVVGVTHWGHLQGSMFRPNAYLVRADGTQRPSLTWLQCFVAGGGASCSVPDYVPVPREGDAGGLELQAEDYDDAQGVLALGDQVAYTDDGDWQSFGRVRFRSGWDTFSVTYAKGNAGPSSITVHVGSLGSAPVLTVPLPLTADWGTSATVSVPWAPLGTEQDVFIQYHGGFGVANVDRFRFSSSAVGENVLANGDFETDASGWFSWAGTVGVTSTTSVTGSQSLLVSNRPSNGPAATSLTSRVVPGTSYQVSFWVSIQGAAQASVNVTQKIECDGVATYGWLASPVTVQQGQWVELTGTLAVPTCNLTDLLIYAEGPPAGVDLLLDNVSVRAPVQTNALSDGAFESSTGAWFSWDGVLATTSARAHSGAQSARLTNRAGNGPIARSLVSVVTPGKTYAVSAWTSIGGAASANVNLTSKIQCQGASASYAWLAPPAVVTEGAWLKLTGTLAVPDCTLADLLMYAEGPAGGIDLYLDDVVLTPAP